MYATHEVSGMRALCACAVLVLTLPLAGCGQQGLDAASQPPSVQKIEAAEHAGDGPFSWPEDPSHPVLEIVIEGPEASQSGTILVELMPELAPSSVVNVAELAAEGYYDGTTFHRVIPGFMIQGGDPNSRDRDPTNDGAGRPGRPLPDEFSDAPFLRGVVGMGNKGRQNSTSTQFFIMQADNINLNGRYNVVGRVIDGMDLVDDVARVAIDRTGRWGPKDRPIENIVMKAVRPVGQVAAVKAALALERGETQLASADRRDEGVAGDGTADGSDRSASGRRGSAPPASPSAGEEWERLEAGGR